MLKILFRFLLLFVVVSCSSTKNKKVDDYVFKNKIEKKAYLHAYNNSLQLWEVPYTEEDIKTSFGTAHIIMAGPKNGKELVLLHGMDASSTMWYPNIKTLAKNHRVFAIDYLMEPGKSTLTSKPLSSEEIILWYNEIFNYYKLKNFDIVAASRGGWIATLLSTQKANKIDKVVLLSPAQTFGYIDKPRKSSAALFLKLFPSKRKFEKTLKAFSFYPQNIDRTFKKQFYLANKLSKSNMSMLQMKPFSDEELSAINNPFLVIIGDHDVINSDESLTRAKEFLSHCKTQKIKDAGHFLTIDQPKIINDAILSFLKQ